MSKSKIIQNLESVAHVAMGFGAGLVGCGLLLDQRERDQLPPENDANPVLWIRITTLGAIGGSRRQSAGDREYWSRVRVMDTLNDMREYAIGATVAYPFILAAGFLVGRCA